MRRYLVDDWLPFCFRDFAHPQAEPHIFLDGEPRKQCRSSVLEKHHAFATRAGNQGAPSDITVPAVAGSKPARILSKRRFAAARWAEQTQKFAIGDGEGYAIQRDVSAAGGFEHLAYIADA